MKAAQLTIRKLKSPAIHCHYDHLRDADELNPHPRNPRTHPEDEIKSLAEVIKETGWRRPVTVSNRSGYIVRGHGALAAAKLLGCQVPVEMQNFRSEAEENAHMIADNHLAELAAWNDEELANLLKEIDKQIDLNLTGFDSTELDRLLADLELTEEPPEPKLDQADALLKKWKVKSGQVWELGEHRLLCGDSTNADDVARLLGKDKPLLMVTDPPYGVGYDAKWRNEALRDNGKKIGCRAIGKVQNDDKADWSKAWELFCGDVAYVWHAGVMAATVEKSLIACGFAIRCQIIWAKNNFAIGRGDYHWQHEPCWYAVRKGKKGNWCGDRSQTTLWQIDKPQKSETGHSTQKPVECMARPIRNNSKADDLIYDPFSGSGTTLCACEQLKRKCRAIEIDPCHVAVTLDRLQELGLNPRLEH